MRIRIEKILKNTFLKIFKFFISEKELTASDIDHSRVRKILVISRHRMGDMICILPMIDSLRSFYTQSKLILLTNSNSRYKELFGDHGPFDLIKYYDNGVENFFYVVKEIKDMRPDMVIVPSPVAFSATNHLVAYFSAAKYRTGVRSRDYEINPAEYLLNIKSDFLWDIKKVHQIERNLDLIRQAGIDVTHKNVKINLQNEALIFAERFFKQNFPDVERLVIGVHPGARKYSNVWDAENFAELMSMFNDNFKPYFYISEGPDDLEYVSKLETILNKRNIPYVKYKGELAYNIALISKLSLFITNDTGIMHIVSGLNTPMVALFGETHAWQWGPLGNRKVSVQSPNGRINNISPSQVYETSLRLIYVD